MSQTFYQSPDERLDYDFDFTDAIGAADSIETATVTAEGITATPLVSGRTVKVWIEGGTPEELYSLDLHITTEAGRQKCHSFKIKIRPACH